MINKNFIKIPTGLSTKLNKWNVMFVLLKIILVISVLFVWNELISVWIKELRWVEELVVEIPERGGNPVTIDSNCV